MSFETGGEKPADLCESGAPPPAARTIPVEFEAATAPVAAASRDAVIVLAGRKTRFTFVTRLRRGTYTVSPSFTNDGHGLWLLGCVVARPTSGKMVWARPSSSAANGCSTPNLASTSALGSAFISGPGHTNDHSDLAAPRARMRHWGPAREPGKNATEVPRRPSFGQGALDKIEDEHAYSGHDLGTAPFA
jgi:hypothetical protein